MRSLPNTPMLSRRHFCRLISAVPLAAGTGIALAAENEDDLSADTLHSHGVKLLLTGRMFEKAADSLALASQKEPTDPKHVLALGCAYASRAASLVYAAEYTERLTAMRANFGDILQKWQKMRDDIKAKNPEILIETIDRMKPVLPADRAFNTKDDDHPYRLTHTELQSKVTDLRTRALAAWDKGLALSKTPEEQAEAYYIRGWGLRVLLSYIPADTDKAAAKLPTSKDVTDAFDSAIKAAPTDPLYWQAKGDILDDTQASTEAYKKSLELDPKNVKLWYLFYNRAAGSNHTEPTKDWPIAQGYLRKAQGLDRGNAWPLYEEAGILFRYAPYSLVGPSESPDASVKEKLAHREAVRNDDARRNGRSAIDRIVEGNGTTRYEVPHYPTSVPGLLTVAWHYHNFSYSDIGYFARVRELARAGVGYAQFMASDDNNPDEAVRAAQAVADMGQHMCGDWLPDNSQPSPNDVQALLGTAIAMAGYKGLFQVYTLLGETDRATDATTAMDTLQQRVKTYEQSVTTQATLGGFDSY